MPISQSAIEVTFYEEDENKNCYDVGYDIRPARAGLEDDSKKKDFSKMTFELQTSTNQRFENLEAMPKQLMTRTRYHPPQSPHSAWQPKESVCYKCKNRRHFDEIV